MDLKRPGKVVAERSRRWRGSEKKKVLLVYINSIASV